MASSAAEGDVMRPKSSGLSNQAPLSASSSAWLAQTVVRPSEWKNILGKAIGLLIFDVPPGLALAYRIYRGTGHLVLPTEGHRGLGRGADGPDLVRVELGGMVRRAEDMPLTGAAFGVHIAHVVRLGPDKEMVWVETGRGVAVMQHALSLGQGSVGNLPDQ